MNKENKLIPELRFPEFVKEGEWEDETLNDLYSFIVTNSFSRDNLNYENGRVKNIHYGDIHTKFSTLFDIRKEVVPFINSETQIDKIKSESYCVEGDIIFADASEDLKDVGKSIEVVNVNNEKLLAGMHTLMARQKDSKLIVGFGGHLFMSNKIREQIQKEAQGTKVLGISVGRLSTIKISYPKNHKEQQKIAACLSSLDELITAHNQKLELLKDHKKGLMQNLFPQEGEILPKWRFKEFENDGEWTLYTLKDLTTINQGLQIPISERYTKKVENSFFYITNEFLKSNSERQYYIENPSESVRCIEEDILMTRTGNTGQVVTGVSGAFHNNFFKIQFDRKILNKDFFIYFLKLTDTQRIIMSYAGVSTIPDLNHSDFYRILIKIPSIQEQQKMASCLSSLDSLIAAQAEKIEQLKQHKKGLMQGLFPKVV